MPFIYKGNLNSNGGRQMVEVALGSGLTFTKGDAVRIVLGSLGLAGAGNTVFGILEGFKTATGALLTDNGAGGDFTDTYTTPASNTVLGVVDVSHESIYSVNTDAAVGTTTDSGDPGLNFDIPAGSDSIDEDTGTATTAQFFSFGADPSAATTRLLVKIQESQIKI